MLANFGRNDEAVDRLEGLLRQHPNYRDAHIALGDIHFYRENFDQASDCYGSALTQSRTGQERSAMRLKLGEIDLSREDYAAAKIKFHEALQDDPELGASVEALQKRTGYP